ncbi:MAG: FtsX-like permease family protein [Lachnospiraceae bacterium]|nr:FtsX-like permease family protein [Lachnospiraceae bacterium]
MKQKKHMLIKDFMREIRKNAGRFISIFFIVALGAAFFAGVRSAKYDMKYSADTYYDQAKLMDFRIISTMGLTDEDLSDIKKVEGVSAATGAYSQEVICQHSDKELVLNLHTLCEGVNEPTVISGKMPKNSQECMVDQKLLDNGYYKIGDKVRFSSGTSTALSENLRYDTFTISGACLMPQYLDLTRGTGSIGDGSIDGFAVLLPEAFTQDYYTEIYVQVQDAAQLLCFGDEYTDKIDVMTDRLKAISEAACTRRFEEFKSEADAKLSDAKQQVADAKKKLADAKATLDDGARKLAEGRQEIADNEKKLQESRQKVTDGEAQIATAKQTLADGQDKINNGWGDFDSQEALLKQQEAVLAQNQSDYDSGMQLYQQKYAEYQAGAEEAENQLAAAQTQIDALKQQLADMDAQILQLQQYLASQGLDTSPEYEQLVAGREQLKSAIDTAESTLEAQKNQIYAPEGQLAQGKAALDASLSKLQGAKAALDQGWTQIDNAKGQLAAAKNQLAASQQEIDAGKANLAAKEQELADAKAQIAEGEVKLADAKKQLEEKSAELEKGQKEYEEESVKAEKEIADAQEKIEDNEALIADTKVPSWYVLDRNKIVSYVSYGMDSDRIGNIGKVFPVIFFLVAALVALTAMTRMVEEQRTSIGTLKALGYSDFAIALKYFSYAMLATVTGSILGVAIGTVSLPYVIITSYQILYTGLPLCKTPLNVDQALLAILASVASTGIATVAASVHALSAKPAELMRPEAPKGGRRVILERVTIFWKHLNFTQKSTVRNLMRYKKRFFMTIIGIGGCMALMLVGFGLQDSITVIAKNQYRKIFTYDATVTLNTDAKPEKTSQLLSFCDSYEGMKSYMQVYSKSMDLEHDAYTQSVTMEVPESISDISDYLVLKDRVSQKNYAFPTDGVVLTEKAARQLHVSVGDEITIKEDETASVQAKVSLITENYVLHYMYLTPELYKKLYGNAPEYNQMWLKYHFDNKKDETAMSKAIMNEKACAGISLMDDRIEDIDYMLEALNLVMYVLIISAGLLAFVVLYNLNSINITERKRELATLKVLGFYDNEVGAYVYRENILLTLIGIAVGAVMGIFLHQFVIQTVEVAEMMFGRQIRPISFLYSGLLTFAFSVIVNFMMSYRLKKIDMIESLKSVE